MTESGKMPSPDSCNMAKIDLFWLRRKALSENSAFFRLSKKSVTVKIEFSFLTKPFSVQTNENLELKF